MGRYVILAAVALVAAMAVPAAAETKLSGGEIKAKYSGGRVYANTPSGRVVLHDYNTDGSIVGTVGGKGKGKDQDKGSWWVKGDTLCRKWNQWAPQKPEACFTVEHKGKSAVWYRADGSVYRNWEFVPAGFGVEDDPGERPLCGDVGGYEAYMKKTGKLCRLG